mmetsp:Transcript_18758/g.30637  ORF Transcript_18758/g.30637 Transcript_18758/m.30637 type:complete len:150 (+) Transcript_18758:456-905(+)
MSYWEQNITSCPRCYAEFDGLPELRQHMRAKTMCSIMPARKKVRKKENNPVANKTELEAVIQYRKRRDKGTSSSEPSILKEWETKEGNETADRYLNSMRSKCKYPGCTYLERIEGFCYPHRQEVPDNPKWRELGSETKYPYTGAAYFVK